MDIVAPDDVRLRYRSLRIVTGVSETLFEALLSGLRTLASLEGRMAALESALINHANENELLKRRLFGPRTVEGGLQDRSGDVAWIEDVVGLAEGADVVGWNLTGVLVLGSLAMIAWVQLSGAAVLLGVAGCFAAVASRTPSQPSDPPTPTPVTLCASGCSFSDHGGAHRCDSDASRSFRRILSRGAAAYRGADRDPPSAQSANR